MEPDGDFVVVWTSNAQDGSRFGAFGQRFAESGAPRGSEFRINTYTTESQLDPAVAVGSRGDFVVVWSSYQDGSDRSIQGRRYDTAGIPNNRDGSGSAIFGQRYHASGTRLGSEFQVNSYTTGNQLLPAVSVSPAGGFVVAWAGNGDGSGYGVFSRRFDASGNAVGNDFVVNTHTTGHQIGIPGQVAHDARGNFVVTWAGEGVGDDNGPFAQRFSASGARRGAEFQAGRASDQWERR